MGKKSSTKSSRKQRKKRKSRAPEEEGGGMMMGLRSGFKKTAKAVAGTEKKSTSWLDFLLNLLLIGAVVFLVYRMFFR